MLWLQKESATHITQWRPGTVCVNSRNFWNQAVWGVHLGLLHLVVFCFCLLACDSGQVNYPSLASICLTVKWR